MNQTFFERKIRPILLYVGTIGAIATSIAYIILMFVLVIGFNAKAQLTQTITFAVINAVIGFIIMQFLKVQGVDFAKTIPDNMETMKEWNEIKAKNAKQKKFHSMSWFWTKTVVTDVIVKAMSIAIATAGIIYIVIKGSQDYNMLLLSVVNLILFACFGLLSLVKAYDFYNEQNIPYIKEQVNEYRKREQEEREKAEKESIENIQREAAEREEIIEAEVQRRLEMAKETCTEQGNVSVCSDSGSDLLDSSMGISTDSNHIGESLVVDSNNDCNYILGGSVHTSDGTSTSSSAVYQEDVDEA